MQVSEVIGLKLSRTRDYLRELTKEGAIVAEGEKKYRKYSAAVKKP